VRQQAVEWSLDPAKVGIMGFSAGGYVAAQAALDHTAANRPAFVASIYGCCENAAEVKVHLVREGALDYNGGRHYTEKLSCRCKSLRGRWS
jgi:acetyl esterase/lipase